VKNKTPAFLLLLFVLGACDLHEKISGEGHRTPAPVESAAYEYGGGISTDEYIQSESGADYIWHESKSDYDSSRQSPAAARQPEPGRPPPPDKQAPAPPPPPPAAVNAEPDDILLVPARVAQVPPKPVIVPPLVGEIIVEKGDTLYSLSKKHGVPLRDLVDENKLSAPYSLAVGKKLKLPSARVHQVAAGETLYSISRRYSVDLNSLATENNLSAPYSLAVGQKLKLPATIRDLGRGAAGFPGEQGAKPLAVSPQQELEKLNVEKKKIDAEKKKLEAEKKKIEAEKKKAEEAHKKAEAEKKQKEAEMQKARAAKKQAELAAAEKKNAELENRKKRTAAQIVAQKEKISSSPAKPLPAVAAKKKMKFSWPARGKILSGFGYKSNGLYNDGINIGAAAGTAVKASEAGVVAYAGNELKGMGNLIIIQHANGWMTVYAHLDVMHVQRGAKVAGGEKIGTIGKTGKVSESQLHFEIRNGTKAYDPRKSLAA
jgi:murein DD-endopeptidase MepM/ murein hydrolase activator NlpD